MSFHNSFDATPLRDVAKIETPEQIEVELAIAGVASRAIAYLVDVLVQLVPIIGGVCLVYAAVPAQFRPSGVMSKGENGAPELSLAVEALVSIVLFFVNFGYFALFEVVWKGQTPGKRAMGLRVVRDGGYPIDGRSAMLRNLLRAVDFLPCYYVVGVVAMLLGRNGKRLGDYAGGTLVIKEKNAVAALEVVMAASAGPLNEAERHLVLEFLARRDAMDGGARSELGGALANQLAARLGRPMPADAELFLEELHGHGRR